MPGTTCPRKLFFPLDLLLSAFPSRSKLPRRLGKQSGELMLGLRVFLNTKYANFRLASSVVRTSRVRLGSVSSRGRNDASLVILQTAASLITSVSLSLLLQSSSLYLQTKYIKHHRLFLFSLKHFNSRRNVVQGMYTHYNETKYYIKHCLFSFSF